MTKVLMIKFSQLIVVDSHCIAITSTSNKAKQKSNPVPIEWDNNMLTDYDAEWDSCPEFPGNVFELPLLDATVTSGHF